MTPIPFTLGQLRVDFEGETPVLHGPAADSPEASVEADEAAFRGWIRLDSAGRYRPLPGASTMRPGWLLKCGPALPLAAALETAYPLAMLHREQQGAGTLRVVPLREVLGRQTGRYARAASLPEPAQDVAVLVLCGRCVKQPVWHAVGAEQDDIACPEPCSVMVSLCRDATLWEASPPPSAPEDPLVPWAAFETTGNEIREHYLRARFQTTSADQVGLSDG
ncbi:MAG: hypothetical protein ABIP13_11650 [Tepidiformaceae bacterium]